MPAQNVSKTTLQSMRTFIIIIKYSISNPLTQWYSEKMSTQGEALLAFFLQQLVLVTEVQFCLHRPKILI